MNSVYIETTIPSYLVERRNKQPAVAADQDATREWWDKQRRYFRLFTSVFTRDEASRGDPKLSADRLDLLKEIPTLDIPADFSDLESDLINLFQLPEKATTDVSHLGLAIFHKMDYLLT